MLPCHAANNSYGKCCGSPSGLSQQSKFKSGDAPDTGRLDVWRHISLDRYLMVLVGGGVGALARYILGLAIAERIGGRFPLGTLVINVTGSFLIGLLMTLFTERLQPHPNWRLLLVVGVLGGYTTFSTFEYETF